MSIGRNRLTHLWKLRHSNICSQQAGDPGEPTVKFQSESEGLRSRQADGMSSNMSPSLKVREVPAGRQSSRNNRFSLIQPYCSDQVFSV